MMRSTLCSGTSGRPSSPLGVGDHRLHDVAAEVRVLRARAARSARPVSVLQITWSVAASISSRLKRSSPFL